MKEENGMTATPVQPIVLWRLSHRADKQVVPLADRHYNRQKIGSPQFVPPGRCVVLKTACLKAFWVTSWPFAEYVKHAWAGAWMCSAFRNEGVAGVQSSELIRQAIAVTRRVYGDPPPRGMVTFVDRGKTRHQARWEIWPVIARGDSETPITFDNADGEPWDAWDWDDVEWFVPCRDIDLPYVD